MEENKDSNVKSFLEEEVKENEFRWKIEGFSLLEKNRYHTSWKFKVHDYEWNLNICIGTNISFGLHVDGLPSGFDHDVTCKYNIYDQTSGKHLEATVSDLANDTHMFCKKDMIRVDEFLTSNFLSNDVCIFGVEIVEVLARPKNLGVSQCLSLKKEPVASEYKWTITKFSELEKPISRSETFFAGEHKWHLDLYPEGISNVQNNISLFLYLEDPIEHALQVSYTLSVVNQKGEKHHGHEASICFQKTSKSWGWDKFLSHQDFYDPSEGYIVDDSCIIEAKVAILGVIYSQ